MQRINMHFGSITSDANPAHISLLIQHNDPAFTHIYTYPTLAPPPI